MNKLLGFYQLRELNIPTVDWKEFNPDVVLSGDVLWTVRTAVVSGADLHLPRLVGASTSEAMAFALELREKYGDSILIFYYPYFVAKVSGTLQLFADGFVVECVEGDLWHLVSESKCDMTVIHRAGDERRIVKKEILSQMEYGQILDAEKKARGAFRQQLALGESFLLEWSFAYTCDRNGERMGEPYLVFYECRSV